MFWFSEHTTVYKSNYSSIFLAIQQVKCSSTIESDCMMQQIS